MILLLVQQRVLRLRRGRARNLPLLTLVSSFPNIFDWLFVGVLLTLLYLSDKQAEDQPKSPVVAFSADLVVREMPQQEVEKSIEGSTAVAWEILGYHSVLAVSSFVFEYMYFIEYFVLTVSL